MWWQIYSHVALWRKANFTDRRRLMLYNYFRAFDELFGESWLWQRVACSRIIALHVEFLHSLMVVSYSVLDLFLKCYFVLSLTYGEVNTSNYILGHMGMALFIWLCTCWTYIAAKKNYSMRWYTVPLIFPSLSL